MEVPVYDILILFQQSTNKLSLPDTKVKEIKSQQNNTNLVDISITPDVDVKLISASVAQITHLPNTMVKITKLNEIKAKDISISDVSILKSEEIVKRIDKTIKLDTQVAIVHLPSGLETLMDFQKQLPIFEELIKCDRRFPRGFSESSDSPFVVLIGENEKEWHIPIIYALKELFREITDKYPRITFREPEPLEEGSEEIVDSLDLHFLDQFSFEYKIEFLDARRGNFAVDEFVKIVRGRLKSGFLQQFGILVIAVKPSVLERAKKSLKIEGLEVYESKPDDGKYNTFCSKILGLTESDDFLGSLKKNEEDLESTSRLFSTFVKRGGEGNDKYQYPLKVATFVFLLNKLLVKRKIVIRNYEELARFISEVVDRDGKIKTEDKKEFEKGNIIITDITYSPDGKEIYVEIETLIGTVEPLKKIDETVEKYKRSDSDLWIILKPVSALLHYEELKSREKAYRIIYSNKAIKFKVLTLLTYKDKIKWNLVDIYEFVRGS